MPGPAPNPNRQRHSKTPTRASLEAPAATRVLLPTIFVEDKCVTRVALAGGCTLAEADHDVPGFVSINVEPHEYTPATKPWSRMVKAWWETIWDSPMSNEWVDADIPGLFALAALVEEYWRKPTATLAAEIRFQQREFGLSPLARRQLQWEVRRIEGTPTRAEPVAAPTRAHDPRLRLVSSSGAKK